MCNFEDDDPQVHSKVIFLLLYHLSCVSVNDRWGGNGARKRSVIEDYARDSFEVIIRVLLH